MVMIHTSRVADIKTGALEFLDRSDYAKPGPQAQGFSAAVNDIASPLSSDKPYEIVIRPATLQESLGLCDNPVVVDMAGWQETADEINAQFSEYALPIHISVATTPRESANPNPGGGEGGANILLPVNDVPVIGCIPPVRRGKTHAGLYTRETGVVGISTARNTPRPPLGRTGSIRSSTGARTNRRSC
jgi:hypothetical protein